MRIIYLNAWYATVEKPFYNFIQENSPSTDIFCLTEVHPEMFSKLETVLTGFNGFYEESVFDEVMKLVYGQATFVRKGIDTKRSVRIATSGDPYAYAVPYTLDIDGNSLTVVNFHGKSQPPHKLDTEARLKASREIVDFLKNIPGSKIIGGDFNILPEAKSIKMFEEAGYRNLIIEFGIKTTRNHFVWEQARKKMEKMGKAFVRMYHSDYIFVSPEVKIKNFEVPDIEISDHLPLILDFEL